MKELLIKNLVPVVATATCGLITAWVSMVLVKVKTWVETKTKNELIAWALERVTYTTETVVASLNQTLVANLKSASADGKLTVADATNMKKIAVDSVLAHLSDDIKNNASMGVQELGVFIGKKVEQAVSKTKVNMTAVK